jgi:hypothetical protein
MGYITSGATVYIDCFLTQKGKELFFIGEDEDIIVKYFSLGDSDTNYVITNNLNITTQDDNVLTEGFIPSISGNYDECAKSIAGGIKLKFEIPIKAINKVLNQYCEGQTLVETLRDPNGNVFIKKTPYSSSCGFNYYSAPISQSFIPNIIPIEPTYITGNYDTLYQNYYIAPYTVTIPYGTFTSSVSQLDADNKTINYINDNGQTLADNNAIVTYYSRERYLPNEKIDNSLIFPGIYDKIDLFYTPNLFTSNTYIDNNKKINDFVQSTKQDYLNYIKNSIGAAQYPKRLSLTISDTIEDIPANEINNIYNNFISNTTIDSSNKIVTLKLKNPLVTGKINPFLFELYWSNVLTNINLYPFATNITLINSLTNKSLVLPLYRNSNKRYLLYASTNTWKLLDDSGYDTVVITFDRVIGSNILTFTPVSLNFIYTNPIQTYTYIIPETSVTVPVPNNNTYKGATLYLDKTTKKYNNVDVLI